MQPPERESGVRRLEDPVRPAARTARRLTSAGALPPDHPQRVSLNQEVHARPPERLASPCRVSYLALLADPARRREAWARMGELAARFGAPPSDPESAHYSADFGPFRLRGERHTEFVRFTFIAPGLGAGGTADPFADPAIAAVPAAWVADLPGDLLVATHAAVVPYRAWPPDPALVGGSAFDHDAWVGALIAGGAGAAFTDLRIGGDGFSRLLILDHELTPGQCGRALQRLLEIDTYRMLALLAVPIARGLMGATAAAEQELASLSTALVSAVEHDEPSLLDRLTRLAALIEGRQSETLFRFSAAASYFDLVRQRIADLREARIVGLQTFHEFIDRRLTPAMNTCLSLATRQEALSLRVAHATELLSTRVDLSSERQSHALLASMNRRAQLQLRLQATVEGLSVAAVTYYVVGLVGHAAEGLSALGVSINPAVAMAGAIPVVAILVALGVRRLRRNLTSRQADPEAMH